jgi:hypothetical protein
LPANILQLGTDQQKRSRYQRIKSDHFLDRCHVGIQVSHDLRHGNIHKGRVQRAYKRRRGNNNHWYPGYFL